MPPKRLPAAFLALLSLGIGTLLSTALQAGDKQPSSVADLRYGVTLYEYFQQDYLAALSELQVADYRGGIQGHGSHPLILKGAMSLAFGMDRTATGIFQQASLDTSSPQVRNAAWFYLARMRFRRADWVGARASLNRIAGEIDPALEPEVKAMRVNLAIRGDQLAAAESALDRKDKDSAWQPYLYYNLGTAHLRARQPAQGFRYLDQLAAMQPDLEEHWSIQEKGLIAAGFSLIEQGDYAAAQARFSRVRQNSPMSEQALLGYGWSSAELGEYQQALGPWQMLAQKSPLRPAVQEALLAVPYAYEKLDAPGSALREFESAESVFETQIALLESMKTGIRSRDLLAVLSDESAQQFDTASDPRLYGLIELLSGDRFSLYRRDLRDLLALQERLVYWRRNVEIYRAMLAQRKLRREQMLERMAAEDYPLRLQQLTVERRQLAGALADAATAESAIAIADADTRALWKRILRAESALQRLESAGEDMAGERLRLQRFRGLLQWQISERYSDWHWQASKRLQQLDRSVQQTQASLQRLQQVVAEVPDIAPFEQRLQVLASRLQTQTLALKDSFQSTEAAVQAMVVDELEQQQDRLRHYQSQARLARARLYDRAQLESQR